MRSLIHGGPHRRLELGVTQQDLDRELCDHRKAFEFALAHFGEKTVWFGANRTSFVTYTSLRRH